MNVIVKPIFIDLPTVAKVLCLSESTVQALTRDASSNFPRSRMLSGRRVGWLLREIESWSEERPVSDLPPPPNTGAKKPKTTEAQPVFQDDQRAA